MKQKNIFKTTAAETAADVTPSDKTYPPGNVLRYGAKGDGTTDDYQTLLDLATVRGLKSNGTVLYAKP